MTLGQDGSGLWAVETSGYARAVLNMLEELQGEQEEIRRLNAQLEDRVRERTEDLLQRTAELKAANQELEDLRWMSV